METKNDGTNQKSNTDLVIEKAQFLTNLYFKHKSQSVFKRTLEECLTHEAQKVAELSVIYLPNLVMSDIKFLRGQYFIDNNGFNRFQEIPGKYFFNDCQNYYFISHRWLTSTHPDPNGEQFRFIKTHFDKLKDEVQQSWGFWYDYSCLPQKGNSGILLKEEESKFQSALKIMHLLPMLSSNIMIFDYEFLNRTWCSMEWMCATKISPIPTEEKVPIPFYNAIKFRHLALITLFLMKDDEFRKAFLAGEDTKAMPHLNSLIYKSLLNCSSTIENDKNMIISLMYEHFWKHLRLVGFRTLLMIAFLILERLDEESIRSLFIQFLIITDDVDLNWTQENVFVLESLINGIGTPTNNVFYKGEIKTKSNSSTDIYEL